MSRTSCCRKSAQITSQLVKFNQWQACSYSREQLIEKLDAAMKAAGE
jgi:hypothetical protein